MTVRAGASPQFHTHWEFPVPAPLRYRDPADYAAHFTEVLGGALQDRLRARDALIFLSGGMDSTTLAATAQRAAPEVTLFTLTSGFPATVRSDDDRLAPLVARHLGLAHDYESFDDTRPLAWLEDPSSYAAQPVDNPDVESTRRFHAAAARRAPIAVLGEDGDTLLQPPTLLAQMRSQPFLEVAGAWYSYWRQTGRRPWAGLEWRSRLRRALGQAPADRTPWLLDGARRMAGEEPAGTPHPVRPRTVAALTSGLWESVYEEQSPSFTKAEVLVTLPFVDPRVIEFVFAIPPVPWGENKQLLRAAMRDRLPAEVLARPKVPYGGFIEARVAQWRAAGGARTQLSERVAPWVDRAQVAEVYRTGSPFAVIDAWRVLELDRWLAHEAPGHA
jgi:asparagine synthase (glutamine-hydrolysing)